jgi:hypothetical protein
MPAWRVARFVVRELVILVVGMPLAAWGILNHFIPAAIVRIVAVNFSTDRDKWASNVVGPTIVLVPLFYMIQVTAAWFLLPASLPIWWTALYAISLPVSGLFAILYRDRVGNIWHRSRTFFLFLKNPDLREQLGREGHQIIEELTELGQLMDQSQGEGIREKREEIRDKR